MACSFLGRWALVGCNFHISRGFPLLEGIKFQVHTTGQVTNSSRFQAVDGTLGTPMPLLIKSRADSLTTDMRTHLEHLSAYTPWFSLVLLAGPGCSSKWRLHWLQVYFVVGKHQSAGRSLLAETVAQRQYICHCRRTSSIGTD